MVGLYKVRHLDNINIDMLHTCFHVSSRYNCIKCRHFCSQKASKQRLAETTDQPVSVSITHHYTLLHDICTGNCSMGIGTVTSSYIGVGTAHQIWEPLHKDLGTAT